MVFAVVHASFHEQKESGLTVNEETRVFLSHHHGCLKLPKIHPLQLGMRFSFP